MLQADAEKRPSADELLASPLLKSDHEKLLDQLQVNLTLAHRLLLLCVTPISICYLKNEEERTLFLKLNYFIFIDENKDKVHALEEQLRIQSSLVEHMEEELKWRRNYMNDYETTARHHQHNHHHNHATDETQTLGLLQTVLSTLQPMLPKLAALLPKAEVVVGQTTALLESRKGESIDQEQDQS